MDHFKKRLTNLTNKYYKEVVRQLLPNAEQGTSYAFEGGSINDYLEISPIPNNGSLSASQYEYPQKELKFVHYTKMESAKSIIKSAKMRIYSLASMNDEQELSYALSEIIPDKSDFTIDTYKSEVFSLSMNEFQNELESTNTWEEYGDKGMGVGLVLSFPKDFYNDWYQHYLSKIHYEEEKLKVLHQYHERHTDFIRDNNIKITGQIKHFVLPLAAFHKTKGYKKENEVRFIVVNTSLFNSWDERNYNIFNGNNNRSYVELELHPSNKERFAELRPIPKIEKIILGPNLIETAKLKVELNILAKESLGYEVKVEKSKLII